MRQLLWWFGVIQTKLNWIESRPEVLFSHEIPHALFHIYLPEKETVCFCTFKKSLDCSWSPLWCQTKQHLLLCANCSIRHFFQHPPKIVKSQEIPRIKPKTKNKQIKMEIFWYGKKQTNCAWLLTTKFLHYASGEIVKLL